MRRAGIQQKDLRSVVISHEHWDHVGGLWRLLEKQRGLTVYLPSKTQENIKRRVCAAGGHVIDSTGVKTLKPGVHVTDEIMGSVNGEPLPEQSVIVESPKGLIIIVGCSHPGILTIVQNAKRAFNTPVYGVIGGFHLMDHSSTDIQQCARDLANERIAFVSPTHCTGWRAERIFHDVFHEGFVPLRDGQTLSFA